MRTLLYATIVTLCACGHASGASSAGGDLGPAATAGAPLSGAQHFDEAAQRAAICSPERPLDFYENRDYCLADPWQR